MDSKIENRCLVWLWSDTPDFEPVATPDPYMNIPEPVEDRETSQWGANVLKDVTLSVKGDLKQELLDAFAQHEFPEWLDRPRYNNRTLSCRFPRSHEDVV